MKNGCKRDGFIPGSGVDQILTEIVKSFGDRGLTEIDINDEFLARFIKKLKTGATPVPVSYVNHRVAYCRAEEVGELIAG